MNIIFWFCYILYDFNIIFGNLFTFLYTEYYIILFYISYFAFYLRLF
jgi:hypothetical protein